MPFLDWSSSRTSARCKQRPELVGAARRHTAAELGGPMALVAEIVAPREHAQGEAVQDVLLREPDGAMDLVRDGGALLRRLGGAYLCGGGFQKNRLVEMLGAGDRVSRRAGGRHGGRDLAGKPGEVVLHGLEFRDRSL